MEVIYTDRELLSSTILYIFIFALLITAPINAVMSRYIADRIFEEEYENILPSFYTGLAISELAGAVVGIPFAARLMLVGGVELTFVAISYLFFMELIAVFYALTYLTATKDYKIVALDFLIGMIVAFLVAFVANKQYDCQLIYAILGGMCVGFWVIAMLQFAYIRHFFSISNRIFRLFSIFIYNFFMYFNCANNRIIFLYLFLAKKYKISVIGKK